MYSIIKTLSLSARGSSRNFDAGVPASELPAFNFRLKKVSSLLASMAENMTATTPALEYNTLSTDPRYTQVLA